MGMFDSVYVPCPQCGAESEFQSKSGECALGQYTLESCPPDVMADINRHSPNTCLQCGTQYYVKIVGISTRYEKPLDKDEAKE